MRVAAVGLTMPRLRLNLPKVAAGLAGIAFLAVVGWVVNDTQRSMAATVADAEQIQVDDNLTVNFSQSVKDGFTATLTPAVKGTWKPEPGALGVRGVTFDPAGRFEAGQMYTVSITGLHRAVTGAELPDITQKFTTQLPAAVASTKPAVGEKDVSVTPKLSVTLREKNHGVRELVGTLAPAVPVKLVSNDDQTYTWEPAASLAQGVNYVFTVTDARVSDAAKAKLASVSFTTVAQPNVLSARTGGYFSPGQAVTVVFDRPMAQSDSSFAFDAKGKGAWADDHTYKFTPSDLQAGKTYGYRVVKGAKSKAGGVVEADRWYNFSTNGAVGASINPGGGDTAVNSNISVAFDQPVDHASAQQRFSLSPAVNGSFSWNGNTMVFDPAGLAYQTAYTVAVAPGVAPVWGLPSGQLSAAFTTVPEVVQLNVPAIKGQYWMSCELTSLQMLLAYRGINVDQWAILQAVGYSPRPRDTATNTWDDPNKMFVGDVNGRPNTTGYGVHAGPLAAAGVHFGRNTQAYYGVGAAWISGLVHGGNPVAFYSYSDAAPRPDSWNTPGGYVVNTMYPQHARVIYGVKGSASNPLGFYIHDPMDGSSFYWTAQYVIDHMNSVPGVSNQAVVVY